MSAGREAPRVLCTDLQLAALLATYFELELCTDLACLTPEAVRGVDASLVGEVTAERLTSAGHTYEAFRRAIQDGHPVFFFGGWRSFAAGGWGPLNLLPPGWVRLSDSPDYVQTFAIPESTPRSDAVGLGDLSTLGPTAGVHLLSDVRSDDVLLAGRLRDGTTRPLLIGFSQRPCLAFTGFLIPTGGNRFFFSPGFPSFMGWVLTRLLGERPREAVGHPRFALALDALHKGRPISEPLADLDASDELAWIGEPVQPLLLREMAVAAGEWRLAAYFTERLARYEVEPARLLLRRAESARYFARDAQVDHRWTDAADSYETAAAHWQQMADASAGSIPTGWIAFHRALSELARATRAIECNAWHEANTAASRSYEQLMRASAYESHALGRALLPPVRDLRRAVGEIDCYCGHSRLRRGVDLLGLVRLWRTQRRVIATLTELLATMRVLYPASPSYVVHRQQRRALSKVQRRQLEQIEKASGTTSEVTDVVGSATALRLVVEKVGDIAPPVHHLVMRTLVSSTILAVALEVLGFFSWEAGVAGLTLVLAGILYGLWSR